MECRTMKTLKAMIAIYLISLAFFSYMASAAGGLDRVIGSVGGQVDQSIEVLKVTTGESLYSFGEAKTLAPASVTKLVTSAATLVKFTPSYTFKTRFYHTGILSRGVVRGDLVIVGDGDPFIVSEKLWQLAADLKHLGLKKFTGNIVIDNSLFSGSGRDAGRMRGVKSSVNAYDAPVSAFGVNFNTMAIAIAPDGLNQKPLVGIDPYNLRGTQIENRSKTVFRAPSRALKVQRISLSQGRSKIVVSGKVSTNKKLVKVYRSVNDHVYTAGEQVRAFLLAQGIEVMGRVKEGLKPSNARLLYELESYPLSFIVNGLNHFSNNFIADVLVKRLGAKFPKSGRSDARHQGSYENGMYALSQFLKNKVGVKTPFVLNNGSGLSIKNRLSADQVSHLLLYMAKHMEVFPEFLASLPSSGRTGTLKSRFNGDISLKGKIRAKTGTLSQPVSVSALAGYLNHPRHGLLAFSIIQNGKKGTRQPAVADLRASQEKIIKGFLKYL